jgi:hypothetical protein
VFTAIYSEHAAGYLNLLSQLTKVGDYDEATFEGALSPWFISSHAFMPS